MRMHGEARSKVTGKGLKDADILAIRALPGPLKVIAAQFGVSVAMISLIRNRRKWRHVKSAPCVIG